MKEKALKMRDLLNNLADIHVDTNDIEDVVIRASLGLAIQGLEDFAYDGKQSPSVIPLVGLSEKQKEMVFGFKADNMVMNVHGPFDGLSFGELEALIVREKKIQAIKDVRSRTGWGLKESKEHVEGYINRNGYRLIGVPNTATKGMVYDPELPLTQEEVDYYRAGEKIRAIKELRKRTLWGLKEAKEHVEKFSELVRA
jgi:ribosomal protein L7/L12